MINSILKESGACAFGILPTGETPDEIMQAYDSWLAEGNASGMDYMANHRAIRKNPEELLADARTIICLAFPYSPSEQRHQSLPAIASYAYGVDYHDVIKKRLRSAVERLRAIYGGEYRICVDSAPIFERYWAEKAGIGTRSDNGLIAIPGYGTRVFLAEILTTIQIESFTGNHVGTRFIASTNSTAFINSAASANSNASANAADPISCIHCGACRRACPAGALRPDSSVDARRCLSYLTIEHRGEWDEIGEKAMSTSAGRHTLFGCDICQQVCPMNAPLNPGIPPTEIEEFRPLPGILTLTASEAKAMTQPEFSAMFKGSAIKRTKLAGFLRNARNISD